MKSPLVALFFALFSVLMVIYADVNPFNHLPSWQKNFPSFFLEQGFTETELANLDFTYDQTDSLIKLLALKKSYPELIKNWEYKSHQQDWLISMSNDEAFYLGNGRNLSLIFYGGEKRSDIETQIVDTIFLGYEIRVHNLMLKPLMRVEEQILTATETDDDVVQFIESLDRILGYSWRNVAGTNNLSYHALGLALDILPRNLDQPIYWVWERERNPNWRDISPADRWQIPTSIVEAFEAEGFFWGANWPEWDIMHFEYSPHIFKARQLQQNFNSFIERDYFRGR